MSWVDLKDYHQNAFYDALADYLRELESAVHAVLDASDVERHDAEIYHQRLDRVRTAFDQHLEIIKKFSDVKLDVAPLLPDTWHCGRCGQSGPGTVVHDCPVNLGDVRHETK